MAETLPTPASRREQFLNAVATGDPTGLPEPASRKEVFLATAAGIDGLELPEPASREEEYLKAIAENGGGGGGGGDDDFGTVTYTKDGVEVTGTLQNFEELESLCNIAANPDHKVIVDGEETRIVNIKSVSLGKSAVALEDSFLYGATNLTSVIAPYVKIVGSYALGYAGGGQYLTNVEFPSLEFVGGNFMAGDQYFNKPIALPKAKLIGSYFMSGCSRFDQDLDLPEVEEIGTYFLASLTTYNKTVSLPKVKVIYHNFLQGCTTFNKPLDLLEVESIGNNFLSGDSAFNSTLSFPKLKTVGQYFLRNCTAFNQDITIPDSFTGWTDSGTLPYFMNGVNSFTANFTCNCPIPTTTSYSYDYMLRATLTNQPIWNTGFNILGDYASAWKSKLPNQNNYRKVANR